MSETKGRILVVDDEPSLRFVLSRGLAREGYEVDTAENVAEAERSLAGGDYLCVFLDIVMPDGSGLDLLRAIRRPGGGGPAVVVMTAEATMQNAIEAMQRGAFDYLTKPFDLDDVASLVARVADYRRNEEHHGSSPLPAVSADELVGRAPAMQEVFKIIGRAAASDVTVLITGPTGAGKELVARAFHRNSGRADRPFVTVNCAAIPHDLLESELFGHVRGAFTGAVDHQKGKFVQADGGSILLDEVGDMPLQLQAKMLRVLQEREVWPVGAPKPVHVDVRVIASTNRDLAADVAAGRFREDLYHRLNVVHVTLPPLDRRRDDIPALVAHLLQKIARAQGDRPRRISPEGLALLMARSWPGNVRELENVVRRAVLLAPGDTLTADDLRTGGEGGTVEAPLPAAGPVTPAGLVRALVADAPEGSWHEQVIGAVERELIREALAVTGGVQTKAAKLLGINRNTLNKKIHELSVEGARP